MLQFINFLFGLDEIDELLEQVQAAEDEYEAEEILSAKLEEDPSIFQVLTEYIGANPTEDVCNLSGHIRGDVAWCTENGYHLEEFKEKKSKKNGRQKKAAVC